MTLVNECFRYVSKGDLGDDTRPNIVRRISVHAETLAGVSVMEADLISEGLFAAIATGSFDFREENTRYGSFGALSGHLVHLLYKQVEWVDEFDEYWDTSLNLLQRT